MIPTSPRQRSLIFCWGVTIVSLIGLLVALIVQGKHARERVFHIVIQAVIILNSILIVWYHYIVSKGGVISVQRLCYVIVILIYCAFIYFVAFTEQIRITVISILIGTTTLCVIQSILMRCSDGIDNNEAPQHYYGEGYSLVHTGGPSDHPIPLIDERGLYPMQTFAMPVVPVPVPIHHQQHHSLPPFPELQQTHVILDEEDEDNEPKSS